MTGQREAVQAILEVLSNSGLALVPREPSEKMVADAWADAHEEDALGVWKTMIASYEGMLEDLSIGK